MKNFVVFSAFMFLVMACQTSNHGSAVSSASSDSSSSSSEQTLSGTIKAFEGGADSYYIESSGNQIALRADTDSIDQKLTEYLHQSVTIKGHYTTSSPSGGDPGSHGPVVASFFIVTSIKLNDQ